jgi:hypothetical protein
MESRVVAEFGVGEDIDMVCAVGDGCFFSSLVFE